MNKIEQMHLDAMYEAEYETVKDSAIYKILMPEAASNCLKVTEQIAIEFSEWQQILLFNKNSDWLIDKTTKELFQEFLKTKQ